MPHLESRRLARRGRLSRLAAGSVVVSVLVVAYPARLARAQQAPAPLPPLPPAAADAPPQSPPSAPPRQRPAPVVAADAPPPPPPPPPEGSVFYGPFDAPPPPPSLHLPPPPHPPKHAPRLALWTGARFGVLGFGGGFYGVPVGNPPVSTTEWTTDLVTPGPTLQADVGVRLGYRFVPFVFYERAILGVGSRFAGESGTSAYSELYGLGLRFVAGDVNTAAFLTEISVGERTVGVSANGQTFKMSGFEYFKLGLGAEIRLSTHLTISPLASLSTGSMTSTSGSVTFSTAGSADGNTHPPFENGASITDQRGYVMLSLTCGAHFDLLGN
jgi:hypothetical protein